MNTPTAAPVTLTAGRLRKATSGAAGFDLFAAETTTIYSKQRAVIPTGVYLEIGSGFCGVIRDRSGLAANSGLTTFAGLIDSDYRNEVKVVTYNSGVNPVVLQAGDRVAQIVFLPCAANVTVVGDAVVELGGEREGGFGSTGKA